MFIIWIAAALFPERVAYDSYRTLALVAVTFVLTWAAIGLLAELLIFIIHKLEISITKSAIVFFYDRGNHHLNFCKLCRTCNRKPYCSGICNKRHRSIHHSYDFVCNMHNRSICQQKLMLNVMRRSISGAFFILCFSFIIVLQIKEKWRKINGLYYEN